MIKSSLLIPCYKAKQYLPNLKQQVDALDPQFDEVILVDDFSEDGTYELAQELGFQIYQLEYNHGPGGARNVLAKMASGEWVHFLDVDDEIMPHYLSSVLPFALPYVDIVLCAGDFLNETDRLYIKRWEFSRSQFTENPMISAFTNPIPSFCSFIKREKFIQIGGFDETTRCWEDGDMHFRLAVQGAKFKVSDEILSVSLRHDRGASSDHLYCHRSRVQYIKKYINMNTGLPKHIFVEELRKVAWLLYSAGEKRDSKSALLLASKSGLPRAESGNILLNFLLKTLPKETGYSIQFALRNYLSKSP